MRVLYEAMQVVVRALLEWGLKGFVAKIRESWLRGRAYFHWNRTAVKFWKVRTCQDWHIVLRWGDLALDDWWLQKILSALDGWSEVNERDKDGCEGGSIKSWKQYCGRFRCKQCSSKSVCERENVVRRCENVIRYRRSFFPKMFMALRRVERQRNHSPSTFALLHNVHLVISKLEKGCTVIYMLLDRNKIGRVRKGKKVVVKLWAQVYRGCNLLFSTMESKGRLSGLCLELFRERMWSGSKGIFVRTGLRSILEEKLYKAWDGVFCFVATFIDRSKEQ